MTVEQVMDVVVPQVHKRKKLPIRKLATADPKPNTEPFVPTRSTRSSINRLVRS